jgi:hypothetical protein
MASRNNKRRRQQDPDTWVAAQEHLPANIMEVNWSREEIDIPAGQPTLHPVDEHVVKYQHRQAPPSVLEAPGKKVNFYAENPTRDAAHNRTYVAKIVGDKAGVTALGNTLLELSKKIDAPMHIITIDPVPRWLYAKEGGETQASQAAKSKDMPQCANCKRWGHKAHHCVSPYFPGGSIVACGFCNTTEHFLDKCPTIAGNLERVGKGECSLAEFVKAMLRCIVDWRSNKPALRSTFWPWPHVVEYAYVEKVIAKELLEKPFLWAWTNEFTLQVSKAQPGDPILQGKIHPSQYDYKRHTAKDLPVDPLLAGKTGMEIIAMLRDGKLAGEAFMTKAERDRAAELNSAMVAEDGTRIKDEPDGDVVMLEGAPGLSASRHAPRLAPLAPLTDLTRNNPVAVGIMLTGRDTDRGNPAGPGNQSPQDAPADKRGNAADLAKSLEVTKSQIINQFNKKD